jgi:hypothetical protein
MTKNGFFPEFYDLKNVKISQRSLKICPFWPILATIYEFKSRFEKSWLRKEL